jgi:putative lipoic acid-binding regulatory protein
VSENAEQAQGLEFPCDYPIKAMGRSEEAFALAVVEIVSRHVGPVSEDQVRSRASNAGNFQSITVTIRVESRSQLEAIYQALADHELVLWTL